MPTRAFGRLLRSRPPHPRLAAAGALTSLLLAVAPQAGRAVAHPTGAAAIASIRFASSGATVQAPPARARAARPDQALIAGAILRTTVRARAVLAFSDRTVLELNGRTALVLRSAHESELRSGEAEQFDAPGTDHGVRTNAALLTATGTIFDVRVAGPVTTVTVVEGAVLVSNSIGSVVVETGQRSVARKGEAPSPPLRAPAGTVGTWANGVPRPHPSLGTDVALAANGGSVIAASSQRAGGNFVPQNAIDGRLDRGWQTADGATTNESIEIAFAAGRAYHLRALVLDCAATSGQPPGDDLRQFRLDIVGGGSTVTPMLSGDCRQSTRRQVFAISGVARAVQLDLLSNHGGHDGIALAEIEVYATPAPSVLGTPTPSPTPTATPSASPTPSPTAIPTPTTTTTSIAAPSSGTIGALGNGQCPSSQRFCAFFAQGRNFACDLAAGPADGSGNTPIVCAATPIDGCPGPSFATPCRPTAGVDTSGHFLVCVDIAEVNEYGPPFNSSGANFRLTDVANTSYPSETTDMLSGTQAYGGATLSAGQEDVGWLCFGIPPHAASYALQWNDHIAGDVLWQTMGTLSVQ